MGLMAVQELDGITYTMVDDETFVDENGGEWVLWELEDVQSQIAWAESEMRQWGPTVGVDEDSAACYMQAAEVCATAEESLRVICELWALSL